MSQYPRVEVSRKLIDASVELLTFDKERFVLGLEELGATDQAIETSVVQLDYIKPRLMSVFSEYDPKDNVISLYLGNIHANERLGVGSLASKWMSAIANDPISAIANSALAYEAHRLADHSVRESMGNPPDEVPLLERIRKARDFSLSREALIMFGDILDIRLEEVSESSFAEYPIKDMTVEVPLFPASYLSD